MRSKLHRPANRRDVVLFRVFAIGFGCVAVIWGLVSFPVFWRAMSIEHIAKRVIAGDPFKIGILTAQVPILEGMEWSEFCYPAGLQSAAIIRLRIVEAMTAAGEKDGLDTQMNSAGNSILASLSCSPADPFLWLAMFTESARNGFHASQLQYLCLSYRLGPNEAWIGLKRNGIALANFERLPPDLREAAIAEFVALVNSGGFNRELVSIFTGPGWPIHDLILPRLKNVSERNRQTFADALYRQGLDVTVPGSRRWDPRSWHRAPLPDLP